MALDRYYIINDDNAAWVCDRTTGKCVDTEPRWFLTGKTGKIRDGRLQCLKQRCANLNKESA